MAKKTNKKEDHYKWYLDEYQKCKADPIYFISNYTWVIHPIRGKVKFKLYEFQKTIIEALEGHRFNIIRKFRQAGITTLCAAYALYKMIFFNDFSNLVVSIGDRESREFLKRLVYMYYELEPWIKPNFKEKNKHILQLKDTDSITTAVPSAATAGRGFSISQLIVDEAAFIDDMEEFWTAIYPTISTGGKVLVISTVNGMGNWYHTKWEGAVTGRNEFNPIILNWKDHPEYQKPGWEDKTRSNMSKRQWLQEYECEFLGTGMTFIDSEILTRLRDNVRELSYTKYNNRCWVFEEPHPHHDYLMAVDCSLGRGRDYSAFHIIDLYTGNQVLEYYSNSIPLNRFAEHVKEEGNRYNLATVVCERNGPGRPLIEQLFHVQEYENLWMDEKDFGVQVSNNNRELILSDLEESLRDNWFNIRSKRTVKELLTFVIDEKTGKIEADTGQHDDLVMSLAIAAYAIRKIGPAVPFFHNRDSDFEDKLIFPTLATPGSDYDEEQKEYLQWVLK